MSLSLFKPRLLIRRLSTPFLLLLLFMALVLYRTYFDTSDHSLASKLDSENTLSYGTNSVRPPKNTIEPTSSVKEISPTDHKTLSLSDCFNLQEKNEYHLFLDCIHVLNRQAPLHFENQYPEGPFFIVLLVHKRLNYLEKVIKSLRRVKYIQKATLIVSYDGYAPDVSDLVRKSIDFCRYKEIYHPYSKDLVSRSDYFVERLRQHQDHLPSMTLSPDGSGRVRSLYNWQNATETFIADPRFVQTALKHHYWWLWHVVFHPDSFLYQHPVVIPYQREDIEVLFLEEDHLPSPDLLQAWTRLRKLRQVKCPNCFAVNLGRHYKSDARPNVFEKWNRGAPSHFDNLGLVLNRTSFFTLLKLREDFCSYNDYNWDLTLFSMAHKKLIPETSMTMDVSRLLHIGSCGMHAKSEDCNPEQLVVDFYDRVADPLQMIDEDEQQSRHKVIMKYSSKWLDTPFTKLPTPYLTEGWTDGRLWGEGGLAKELWISDVNRDHCLAVTEGKGWSVREQQLSDRRP